MFGRFFRKKQKGPEPSNLIVARLNARIQPIHRGEIFEDPLHEELERFSIGAVSGGGTMMAQDGEVEFCNIEIEVARSHPEARAKIAEVLDRLGAPKGSILTSEADGSEFSFGVSEGLAVYLNGTDLPDKVYQEYDSNFVYAEFDRLLGEAGRVLSYWNGPRETAFYLYGPSFVDMRARISTFLESYPLCQKCRVVQIA